MNSFILFSFEDEFELLDEMEGMDKTVTKNVDSDAEMEQIKTTPTTTPAPMGIDERALSAEGKESLRKMLAQEEDKDLDEMLRRIEAMGRQGGG